MAENIKTELRANIRGGSSFTNVGVANGSPMLIEIGLSYKFLWSIIGSLLRQ